MSPATARKREPGTRWASATGTNPGPRDRGSNVLGPEPSERAHQRLVRHHEQRRVIGRPVRYRPPRRHRDHVAARPRKGLAVDGGLAGSLRGAQDLVRRGPEWPRRLARNRAASCRGRSPRARIAERHARPVAPLGIGLRPVEIGLHVLPAEDEGRGPGRGADRFVALRVVFVEHRLQQMDERRIEAVHPVTHAVGLAAVAVPAPVGREQHVVRLHFEALAVDDGVGAFALEDEPERVRRMAVGARLLSRQDRLVGGDHGAYRRVGVAFDRIEQDQVAALGELGIDQPSRRIERRAALFPRPLEGNEVLTGRRPQRRHRLRPAAVDAERRERLVEAFERLGVRELR